ncbi:hypothetical protein [Oceanispirochaeta sp.]|uniref:hypothetical protein n=1 Tax=Oceanispirochaeta sp. TaxID=2035350 RepID=UPI002603FCA1|nr:hypothetical protein [Oceanispirochaeta sp.]MDA3955117.1 hypothetical protein [Oceanispirochaeta sp.]
MKKMDLTEFNKIGFPDVTKCEALFDGFRDGLFQAEYSPNCKRSIKIQLDIKPESGGGFEQRFFHLGHPGDGAANSRLMIELRSKTDGFWYLDVYYSNGEKGQALIDENRLYPHGQWYTLEIDVTEKGISGYIDGKIECRSEEVPFRPLPFPGLSLGVRQNQVSWYKGGLRNLSIGEVNER